MEGLRGRITGLLATAVAVVVLLVLAVPSVASSEGTVVHVRMPSATRAYLPVAPAEPPAGLQESALATPEELEAEFVTRLNDLRAAQGLSRLEVDGPLTAVARSWAGSMAADDHISHRSDLADVSPHPDWVRIGENVGVGATVEQLHDAFVDSPAHYENMVDPGWQLVGVGVLVDDGSIWVAVNFLEVEK
jgi:uncharacterized protein YkwD